MERLSAEDLAKHLQAPQAKPAAASASSASAAPAAFPVPPVPPPPEPPAEHQEDRPQRRRGDLLHRFEIRRGERLLGTLVFNKNSGSLDAHCELHGPRCRVNRTLNESATRPAQGRPLGFLLAWLFATEAGDVFACQREHFQSRLGKLPWSHLYTFEVRAAARDWLEADPEWALWLDRSGCKERPMRGDEEREPHGLV